MKKLLPVLILFISFSFSAQSAEFAGITVEDSIKAPNGEQLILNGMGLREKLWIDVYVGSLYLAKKSTNVAEILSMPNALRIQMNFIYKEVSSKKLIKAWDEGFQKNQSDEKIKSLQSRINQFNAFFEESAKKGDQYVIDYTPEQGTKVYKNSALLGSIDGNDFKDALVEIWLGNFPADKKLKKGMLGL